METSEQFGDGSDQSWNAARGSIPRTDATIDPSLGSILCTSAMMNTSLIVDSNSLQPMQIFYSSTQGMSLPSAVPLADTPGSQGTRSSDTTSVHSGVLISPTASRRSSAISFPWAPTKNNPGQSSFDQQTQLPKPLGRNHTYPSTTSSSRQPAVASQHGKGQSDDNAPHDEAKRDEFLKRNRLAASRCRQKKKEWVHQLEETRDELEQQNTILQTEHKNLLDEVSRIKHHLMAHASCNDPNINGWIETEARRVVQSSRQRMDSHVCQ